MWDVELGNTATRFLRKADKQLFGRIAKKIEQLRESPFSSGGARLHGSAGHWRIRIGEYRMLYEVYHEEKRIVIVRIDHRSRVYHER